MKPSDIRFLAVLVAMLAGGIIIFLLRNQSQQKKAVTVVASALTDTVSYRKTDNGQTVASTRTLVIDHSSAIALPEVRRINEELGFKIKHLESVINSRFIATGTIQSPAQKSDSLITFSDGYLSATVQLSDSSTLAYSYGDSLTAIVHLVKVGKWWKPWTWGKKESKTDVLFSNPNAKAVSVRSIIVK